MKFIGYCSSCMLLLGMSAAQDRVGGLMGSTTCIARRSALPAVAEPTPSVHAVPTSLCKHPASRPSSPIGEQWSPSSTHGKVVRVRSRAGQIRCTDAVRLTPLQRSCQNFCSARPTRIGEQGASQLCLQGSEAVSVAGRSSATLLLS